MDTGFKHKMCCIVSGKWNVKIVTLFEFSIMYVMS